MPIKGMVSFLMGFRLRFSLNGLARVTAGLPPMPCPQAAQRSYAHLHHRSPRVSFWVPRCPDVRIYVVYNTDGGCEGNREQDH